eukprot:2788061-Amphidinium_carterae.1
MVILSQKSSGGCFKPMPVLESHVLQCLVEKWGVPSIAARGLISLFYQVVGDDDSMMNAKPKDNMTVLTPVPALNLTDNTWTTTKRVTGVVKANPMKTG